MRKRTTLIGLAVVLLVVASFVAWLVILPRGEQTPSSQAMITATVPHVGVWATNLLAGVAQVQVIASGVAEVHEFSLSPEEVARASSSLLILANGAGLEPWLDDVAAQVPGVPIVETAAGLPLRADDPHTWLDPVLAQAQVQRASDALIEVFPEFATRILSNTEQYLARLAALDEQIRTSLVDLPRRQFIAFHDAFGYFASRYALEQIGQLVERPGDEPTFGDVAAVGQQAQTQNLTSIYIEPGAVPDLIESIAAEFDLTVRVLDPLEILPLEPDAYVAGMEKNLAELLAGFYSNSAVRSRAKLVHSSIP